MTSLKPAADYFVPDGSPLEHALARTTHLGIGAHPDDLEIMAFHGISHCYPSADAWFSGIVLCDGAGSPRSGDYADYSDTEMAATRLGEQRRAAEIGRYSLQAQLGYASAALASAEQESVVAELLELLQATQPRVVYLHNLADSHATHVNAALCCLEALRRLPSAARPQQVWGMEVWRGLDWLPAEFKVALPINDPAGLQQQLIAAHQSQVAGGKHYDRAVLARQTANATFGASDAVDRDSACALAMDLQALLLQDGPSPAQYLEQVLIRFAEQIKLGD
jgi:LmbE family N-acetylglucosaminyl deacetylase